MLKVTALPANFGDCLWIEYGEDPKALNSVLIDGGTGISKPLKSKLKLLSERGGELELVVVTHVDRDHIAGMVALLKEDFFGVRVKDFWFNGLRHLPGESFGVRQGEQLTELIIGRGLNWNDAVEGRAISIDSVSDELTLLGGANLRLLSPDNAQLRLLQSDWIEVCEDAGLYADPMAEFLVHGAREAFGVEPIQDIDDLANAPFVEDSSKANGSSISFIFSYDDKRILLGADAHPSRLLSSLKDLDGQPPYKFELVKLPHHGSRSNVPIHFIEALQSPRYLFSTNGAIHGHPCREAVARTIRHGLCPELIFNYDNEFTAPWKDHLMLSPYPYTVRYGVNGLVTVEIS